MKILHENQTAAWKNTLLNISPLFSKWFYNSQRISYTDLDDKYTGDFHECFQGKRHHQDVS